MANDFRTAVKQRRSNYDLSNQSPVSDEAIREIVEFAVANTPSAFNSQSARAVLLLGSQHKKFWELVRETLRGMVPEAEFEPTSRKLDSFAAGHGTVLFYEDRAVIENLQKSYPKYAAAFPGFSENSAGMLQHVVWVMLRDAGLGASLQHYGNLVEERVAEEWGLDKKWYLVAQMPFGAPNSEPPVPERQPIESRVKVFS